MHATLRYVFFGQLENANSGFFKSVINIPNDIVTSFPRGRHRVVGLVNGAPFSVAIASGKNGSRFFSVNAALRESAALKAGDRVKVVFSLMHPDDVERPLEHETWLAMDDGAGQYWNGFTDGLKKTLAHYVDTAKKMDSRIRTQIEIVQRSRIAAHLKPKKRRARG